MARGHERLRVPEGWQGQARALIQQLERIHDDIYNNLETLKKEIETLAAQMPDEEDPE